MSEKAQGEWVRARIEPPDKNWKKLEFGAKGYDDAKKEIEHKKFIIETIDGLTYYTNKLTQSPYSPSIVSLEKPIKMEPALQDIYTPGEGLTEVAIPHGQIRLILDPEHQQVSIPKASISRAVQQARKIEEQYRAT